MKKELEARLVYGADPKFAALAWELDQEYVRRFGETALKYRQYNSLEKITAACLILKEGKAVACGGIQELDECTAELKRVYVKPEYRKNGLGRKIVETLELQALWQGYTRAALETGREMPEAVSLYTRLGYKEVEPWGPFVGDEVCICMAKDLE